MAPLMELGKLAQCHPWRLQAKPASAFRKTSPAEVSAEGRVTAHSGRRGSNLLSESSSSSSESPHTGHSEAIRRQLAATAASLVLAAGCAPAGAYNVRLQDVENKTMQAGCSVFLRSETSAPHLGPKTENMLLPSECEIVCLRCMAFN